MVTSSERGFEMVDHPADMGLRVWAGSLDELFSEAAFALSSTLTDAARLSGENRMNVTLESADLDTLMYDWLSELLFLFDAEKLLFSRFDVKIEEKNGREHLTAELAGERFDNTRHQIHTYVKAITLHQLKIEQRNSNWTATVFLDI